MQPWILYGMILDAVAVLVPLLYFLVCVLSLLPTCFYLVGAEKPVLSQDLSILGLGQWCFL